MRTLLVLGRVSNLPTVWSNCLAAWVLAGGGAWDRFALVCFGATLLYTGGMFLNDAVDVAFDRQYRPERPIPSGKIRARSVWALSIIWLMAGWAVCLVLGKGPTIYASGLLVLIVIYDLVHKRTTIAPVLMAGCRFFLYLLAASSAYSGAIDTNLLWRALALAAYILGLSYLARGESTRSAAVSAAAATQLYACARLLTVVLLLAPIGVGFIVSANRVYLTLIPGIVLAAWIFWCLSTARPRTLSFLPKFVGGLLAGIALVDWFAAAAHGFAPVFAALFVLALLLQRFAPAT